MVRKVVDKCLCRVTIFRAVGQVNIRNQRLIEFALRRNVKHVRLFAIVDASHLCVVTLLLIRLNLAHQVSGEILHRDVGIAFKEILSVNEEFRNLFTVNLHLPVVINFRTGKLLNQSFERRTLGHTIG